MPTTQYVSFANDPAALTQTPAVFAADAQRPIGNQPGIARPEFVNTALRQALTGVAGVAQFAITKGTLDVPDDGNPATVMNALISAVQAMINSSQFWKTGDVKSTMDLAAQDGWLDLNGQFILQTAFPALYAKGVANGWATTGSGPSAAVRLPDMRGEFPRGLDLGRNVDPGRTVGSAQDHQIVSHTHGVQVNDPDDGGRTYVGGGNDPDPGSIQQTTGTTASSGTVGTETRPRNVALRFLIKT